MLPRDKTIKLALYHPIISTTALEMRVLYSTVTMCLIGIANVITQLVFIDKLASFAEETLQVIYNYSYIVIVYYLLVGYFLLVYNYSYII